ncbi:hypothetical protein BX666DRAFT_861137 [Dichotomocladium elegans]|nr:hypothetical protein BX666DRAFT_861137 [Dichotomocladium elegans]
MRFLPVLVSTAAFMIAHQTLAQTSADCVDPQVFVQCLSDQDVYLRTCKDQEFACLCKWNTVRLQCWDNSCPNDSARGTQAALVQNYCAIADALSPSASSAAPQPTSISTSPTSPFSATPTASDYPDTKSTSNGFTLISPRPIFILAAAGIASGRLALSF